MTILLLMNRLYQYFRALFLVGLLVLSASGCTLPYWGRGGRTAFTAPKYDESGARVIARQKTPSAKAAKKAESDDSEECDREVEQGIASWYGPKWQGRTTANGESFDKDAMTAAHPTLPFGTVVCVRNLENDREIVVRINDRGPYVGDRVIDLSQAAFRQIGPLSLGLLPVEIEILE